MMRVGREGGCRREGGDRGGKGGRGQRLEGIEGSGGKSAAEQYGREDIAKRSFGRLFVKAGH